MRALNICNFSNIIFIFIFSNIKLIKFQRDCTTDITRTLHFGTPSPKEIVKNTLRYRINGINFITNPKIIQLQKVRILRRVGKVRAHSETKIPLVLIESMTATNIEQIDLT